MATFDDLEAQAEAKISDKLGKYQKAATAIGVVFAVLNILFAVLLFTGGALAGSMLAAATSVVLFWLVSLLRAARAVIGTPAAP